MISIHIYRLVSIWRNVSHKNTLSVITKRTRLMCWMYLKLKIKIWTSFCLTEEQRNSVFIILIRSIAYSFSNKWISKKALLKNSFKTFSRNVMNQNKIWSISCSINIVKKERNLCKVLPSFALSKIYCLQNLQKFYWFSLYTAWNTQEFRVFYGLYILQYEVDAITYQ